MSFLRFLPSCSVRRPIRLRPPPDQIPYGDGGISHPLRIKRLRRNNNGLSGCLQGGALVSSAPTKQCTNQITTEFLLLGRFNSGLNGLNGFLLLGRFNSGLNGLNGFLLLGRFNNGLKRMLLTVAEVSGLRSTKSECND